MKKKHRNGHLGRLNSGARFWWTFYRGSIERIPIGNIKNGYGSSRPWTGRLYSRWFKPRRTPQVPSREHQWHQWSEMSGQSPKDTKRQHSPQRQSVHPAATWEKIQKYLHHQTTQQLHSSDCETPQLIINTPFSKNQDWKDSIVSFFKSLWFNTHTHTHTHTIWGLSMVLTNPVTMLLSSITLKYLLWIN